MVEEETPVPRPTPDPTLIGRGLLLLLALAPSPAAAHDEADEEEVRVEARALPRPLTPLSTTELGGLELARYPLRSAEDALRGVPGVRVVQHGSEGKALQFFVRGFDAGHGADFALSVQGVPLNEWSHVHANGYVELGFVLPELIRHVTVTKGPFSLDQGAFANAGSADYTLGVAPSDRGLSAAYTLGTTPRQRLLLRYAPPDGDGRTFLAAEALHDGGFGERRGLARAQLVGQYALGLGHGRSLSFFAAGGGARYELPGTLRSDDLLAGRVGFYDSYDRASSGEGQRLLGSVELRDGQRDEGLRLRGFAQVRRLELLENYTGFLFDPVHGDRRRQEQRTAGLGADLEARARLLETLTLTGGAGFSLDVLSQAERHVGRELEVLEVRRELSATQALANARLGLEWRPEPRLRALLGVRTDAVWVAAQDARSGPGAGALAIPLPRAVLEWAPAPSLTLGAAYGRGYRPPEARAFTGDGSGRRSLGIDVFVGDRPRPTAVDLVDVGLRLRSSRYLGATWSGFAAFVEREAIYDHVAGSNLELNATRRWGTELEVHTHPLDWLLLGADVAWVEARFVESGAPVPFVPWLSFGAKALVLAEQGWVAGLQLVGWAPRELPHGARGATYALLGGTVGYHTERLRFDLAVENVLDLALREGEYHYASSWSQGAAPDTLPALHFSAAPPRIARLTVTGLFR